MLAYASDRRRIAAPRPAPHAMLGIMVAHIALIAAVMSAKMDLPSRILTPPTVVETIPLPKPPPPEPRQAAEPDSQPSQLDSIPIIVPIPQPDQPRVDPIPSPLPPFTGDIGVKPAPIPQPAPASVKIGPRFATPAGLVRPPYPPSKISSEEEATLKLRLSIDASGRVVSVEPVAPADRAFLEAARRHIISRWRYKPASEDGRAVASSTVITLRFELD